MMAVLLLAACSPKEQAAAARTVTAGGSGLVEIEADITLVSSGFWVKDEDANTAIANASSRLAEITSQLAALGIDPADIDSPGATMNSEQIIGPDGYPTERLLYAVNQIVLVTVRDPARLGDVLNSIRVTAGAPYLFNMTVQPELSQERRARVLAEAQRLALEDARANAESLAQQLGLKLGRPVEVTVLSQQVNPGPILQAQVMLQVSYSLED
jgi:uncharacterized protein YggE